MYINWDVKSDTRAHCIAITISDRELEKLTDEYNLIEDLLKAKLPILHEFLYEFVGQR